MRPWMRQCLDCCAWILKLQKQCVVKNSLNFRCNETPCLWGTYPCLICLKEFDTREAILGHYVNKHSALELKYIILHKDMIEMVALSEQEMICQRFLQQQLGKSRFEITTTCSMQALQQHAAPHREFCCSIQSQILKLCGGWQWRRYSQKSKKLSLIWAAISVPLE